MMRRPGPSKQSVLLKQYAPGTPMHAKTRLVIMAPMDAASTAYLALGYINPTLSFRGEDSNIIGEQFGAGERIIPEQDEIEVRRDWDRNPTI